MLRTLLIVIISSFVCADFSGSWVLKNATRGGLPVTIPENEVVTLSVTFMEESVYTFSIHAQNNFNGRMIVKKHISKTTALVRFNALFTTLLEPSPEFAEVENFLSKSISDIRTAVLNESGNLIWRGPQLFAQFSPSEPDE